MKNNGGAAFPCTAEQSHSGAFPTPGMTLRDYFAAKAMAAYASSDAWRIDMGHADTARISYAMADAMLAEREK